MAAKWRRIKTKTEKVNNWTKAEVFIQVGILFVAGLAFVFAWDASKTANELNSKLYDYPLRIIPYPYQAFVFGNYTTGSTNQTVTIGSLNATLIVSSPHIIRVSIEDMTFLKINDWLKGIQVAENGSVVPIPDEEYYTPFDTTKFDEWIVTFATNSPTRTSYFVPTQDNNFTYYTNQQGINTFKVSLPIMLIFYLNSKRIIPTAAQNVATITMGEVTVHAKAFDMQTEETTPVDFSTVLFAQVTIK
jgi:hypothetical protein